MAPRIDDRLATVTLLMALTFASTGCAPTMAVMDLKACAVHTAVTSNNVEALRELFHPDQRAGLKAAWLTRVSRMLASFGEFEKRSFRSFDMKQGKATRSTYWLKYDKRRVLFGIKVEDGWITAFRYDPNPSEEWS